MNADVCCNKYSPNPIVIKEAKKATMEYSMSKGQKWHYNRMYHEGDILVKYQYYIYSVQ